MSVSAALLTPEQLCRQLAAGDQATLQLLFKTFYNDLYKFTWKFVRNQEVAEELTQDIFIYLWENRETLQINSAVKAYLYTMARNRAFNYLKSRVARMSVVSDEVPETYAALSQTPEEELSQQELEKLVSEGIEQLPEKCRIVFNLSRQEGLSYQQIADELQISPKTVEAHMSTALKKLRTFLKTVWADAVLVLLYMFIS
ncbi:RNA polymerase sigma-70 factor [Adhaeribacter soli]|uniref:RNA polymerase sigma-70 factor n=1 Tax=Adhaeribacter soli TaxID=2607655 RepID=A0A5N1INY9_9BACT|nr:RNA polymerase sigma-70 factor [Adhaeribacter soli]KAA9331724.1 RNA polymerase sigma-70 factor [Adhaeribacter soli]